jgi:hypothetical protein
MPSNIEATKFSTSMARTTSASRTCRPPSRCQFHKHFKSNFFVQKYFSKLFSSFSLALLFLVKEYWLKRWSLNVGKIDFKKGKRFSTAKAFLKPALYRKNLHIVLNAYVTKILLSEPPYDT